MKRLLSLGMILASMGIASCGGSGNTITGTASVIGTVAANIELIASSAQLDSDVTGVTTVTITAIAKDENNNVIAEIPIIFSSDSGALIVESTATTANGLATALLSNGSDPTNRTIVVTATDGDVASSISIAVVGTSLNIDGPSALSASDSGIYALVLEDSFGVGIEGETIDVTSANGNTLSSSSLTTGVDGEAQLTLTATVAGNDTLSATALGITATKAVNISDDSFGFLAPPANVEIPLNTNRNVRIEWTLGGAPQVGETINFSSTRGTLSASTAVTDNAGQALVTINSTNAGPAVITATNANNTTTTVAVEFTASVADRLDVQASPFTVASGQQSEIIAIVTDPNGNLVKNQLVIFELTDTTNGFLSVGSGTTDSQGKAQTFYTGGSVPSAVDGVEIRAFVQNAPTVEDMVLLTVAQREVDIFIGTSDILFLPDPARYAQEWVLLATDTVGNPVENTVIQTTLRSVRYYKGKLVLTTVGSDIDWVQVVSTDPDLEPFCEDEDTNRDGFLDLISEDFNGNGSLEAGNVATVFAVPDNADPDEPCNLVAAGGQGADVVTDAQGFARVCVIYPRSVNLWADVELTAQLNVFGSEFSESQQFRLLALASDLKDEQTNPAGQFSPFGQADSCANPD